MRYTPEALDAICIAAQEARDAWQRYQELRRAFIPRVMIDEKEEEQGMPTHWIDAYIEGTISLDELFIYLHIAP